MPLQPTDKVQTDQAIAQDKTMITCEKSLRDIIPSPPALLAKRIQSSLDHFSLEFIEHASVVVLATSSPEAPMQLIDCRHKKIQHRNHLYLLLPLQQPPSASPTSTPASLYFMIAGIGHALRINGTLTTTNSNHRELRIREVYFHCARAAARAQLWDMPHSQSPHNEYSKPEQGNHFNASTALSLLIQRSPYLLMTTQNSEGQTEISPRGDGAGFVKQLSPTSLLTPERPGNKVAVSLRNILQNPDVELLFLIPGSDCTVSVRGHAQLTACATQLKPCVVNGKTPKVGILIQIVSHQVEYNPALSATELWAQQNFLDKKDITTFAKALAAHMNGTGLLGKATAGLVSAVVKHDMKNLY